MTRISEAEYRRLGLPKTLRKASEKRRGKMNNWESSFASEVLEPMRLGKTTGFKDFPEIESWRFEAITLTLYDGSTDMRKARFTPDFMLIVPNSVPWLIEVKGRRTAAGVVRLKSAAQQYPCFRWGIAEGGPGAWRISWL